MTQIDGIGRNVQFPMIHGDKNTNRWEAELKWPNRPPDFNRSNLSISATLAEFLGAPNKNATLPALKAELVKGYKNVVFLCFDGLGRLIR